VTLKKPVSKADTRAALQREVDRFLEKGGNVQTIPQGVSGKEPGDPPVFLNRRLFIEPKAPRTAVPEVVAAIEARRKAQVKRRPVKKRGRLPQPRRKIIYDDFGEPLRKVWVEDD
jgi:SutA RNAP-binding domain